MSEQALTPQPVLLYVFVNGHLAGTLTQLPSNQGCVFTYQNEYLSLNPPVAISLPINEKVFYFNQLPPIFDNLMSEGWLKRIQQLQLACLDDGFLLLAEFSQELIGAVTLLPTLDYNHYTYLDESALDSLFLKPDIYTIQADFDDVNQETVDYMVAGAQPKLFMTIDGKNIVPHNHGELIVKPSSSRFPELAENEFIIMKLAQAVGLPTAECALVPFTDGVLAYVTKRFDIDFATNQKLFIEDGASLCAVPSSEKDNHDFSYELMIEKMSKVCDNPEYVKETCLKLIIFSYLVGNNDLHLKNFSFYRVSESTTGKMTGLTPLYDLVSLAPYPEYDSEYLSLSLLEQETDGQFSGSYEAYGYYTQHDFILLAKAFGFEDAFSLNLINLMIKELSQALPLVMARCSGSEKLKLVISTRIKSRFKLIQQPKI